LAEEDRKLSSIFAVLDDKNEAEHLLSVAETSSVAGLNNVASISTQFPGDLKKALRENNSAEAVVRISQSPVSGSISLLWVDYSHDSTWLEEKKKSKAIANALIDQFQSTQKYPMWIERVKDGDTLQSAIFKYNYLPGWPLSGLDQLPIELTDQLVEDSVNVAFLEKMLFRKETEESQLLSLYKPINQDGLGAFGTRSKLMVNKKDDERLNRIFDLGDQTNLEAFLLSFKEGNANEEYPELQQAIWHEVEQVIADSSQKIHSVGCPENVVASSSALFGFAIGPTSADQWENDWTIGYVRNDKIDTLAQSGKKIRPYFDTKKLGDIPGDVKTHFDKAFEQDPIRALRSVCNDVILFQFDSATKEKWTKDGRPHWNPNQIFAPKRNN
jgi:hypothetical protein